MSEGAKGAKGKEKKEAARDAPKEARDELSRLKTSAQHGGMRLIAL